MSTLSQAILDNLWQAGFCRTLIERVRATQPGQEDGPRRVEITHTHIVNDRCQDCFYANLLKGLEAATAKLLGPAAEAVWMRGGDVRAFPGFDECFRKVMEAAIKTGNVRGDVMKWIERTVNERTAKPYPFTEADCGYNASQTN